MLDLSVMSGQKKAMSLILCVGGITAMLLGNAGIGGLIIAAGAVVYAQSIEDKLEEQGVFSFEPMPKIPFIQKKETKTEEMP